MVSAEEKFVVEDAEAGQRLDKLVGARHSMLGRRALARLFEEGRVCVDGRRARKGDNARRGTTVEVALSSDVDEVVAEPDRAVDVLFESEHVVVVCKPAGLPTAPLRAGETGTLANALIGRYPEMRGIGYRAREPGILHRLDNWTSGVLVAARTRLAFEALQSALSNAQIEKRYHAIVEAAGLPSEGVIDRPLGPDPRDRRRVAILPGPPDTAHETHWRRVTSAEHWALVELSVHRAYRHQIRAHLASIGHPIAGDELYGGRLVPALERRHALHASQAAWAGEGEVAGFDVVAPMPADMDALIAG